MRIQDCLSPTDIDRLNGISATIESPDGEYLVQLEECDIKIDGLPGDLDRRDLSENSKIGEDKSPAQYEEIFNLVEATGDGSIPKNALIPLLNSLFKMKSLCEMNSLSEHKAIIEMIKAVVHNMIEIFYRINGTKKLSLGLSEFLWSSEEGEIQVEFRSPMAGFPPEGQLSIVRITSRISRKRKRARDEFCLVAYDDGTIKWIPESECVDGNNVWTIRLFDHRSGGVLYRRDELRRVEPNVYQNCMINFIGGNVNGSGTQTIGTVNCH